MWLLSLTYAGRVYRIATEAAGISIDGSDVQFLPNLGEVDLSLGCELGADTPTARTAALTITAADELTWALWESRGHSLGTATAELALWGQGLTWEERVVVLSGRVSDPEYGDVDEDLTITLAQEPFGDLATWPPPGARVTVDTWPNAPDASADLVYPWVFGQPGISVDEAGTTVRLPGSPAILVSTTGYDWLIAGHIVKATLCKVWDATIGQYARVSGGVWAPTSTYGSATTWAISTVADGLGRLVSTIDLTIATPQDHEYWVIWSDDGGLPSEDGSEDMTGAGDILRWWLERTLLSVDIGRMATARTKLNRLQLAGYVDEEVNVYGFVRDHLLPLLPVSIVAGPSGLYPVPWDLDLRREDAEVTLTEGEEVERAGRVRVATRDLIGQVRVSWAADPSTGDYTRSTILTGDPDDLDAGQVGDSYATVARGRLVQSGIVPEVVVESDWVHSARVAVAVAQGILRTQGYPRRTLDLDADPWVGALEELAPVVYVDAGLHIDQLVRIQSISWSTDRVSVELLILDDPVRDPRDP